MDGGLGALVGHGSYAALFVALIVAGFGFPIPEEIPIIAGGVLAHEGVTNVVVTAIVCAAGVLGADIAIFLLARRLGPKAWESRRFARLVPEAKREKLERVFDEHGMRVVFYARLIPGVRAPIFAVAGIHRMPFARFMACDVAALCISGPLWFCAGYFFSSKIEWFASALAKAEHVIVGVVAVAIVAGLVWLFSRRRHGSKEAAAPASPASPSATPAPRPASRDDARRAPPSHEPRRAAR